MDYTAHYNSPLGSITMASEGTALIGLWFDGQKYFADSLDPSHEERPELSIFAETRRWLDLYFSGRDPGFTPSVVLRTDSDFRREVWEQLLAIPFGCTLTYGEIAQRIAAARGRRSMSAQAVGGAVGRNPVSLIIPCHRVVGANGTLTGYAGGIKRKAWLLAMEGACRPAAQKLK